MGSNAGLRSDLMLPLLCEHRNVESNGKGRKATLARYGELDPRDQVYGPEDLNDFLGMLEDEVKKLNVVEKRLTTRGCPQSHVLSFPTLNAINYAAFLGARHFFPDLRGQGYGDDFIGSSESREACELVLKAREGFGMMTNTTATGISRGGERGLAVFCEMVFSTLDGSLIENAKPKPVNAFFRSLHANATMAGYVTHVEDLMDVSRMLEKRHQEVFKIIKDGVEPSKPTMAYRQTYPRFILNRIIRKDVGIDSAIATKRSAEEIFAFLESQILLFTPSSKNAPARVDPRSQSVGLLVSQEFHRKMSRALERYSNTKEFKFRDFPAFANAGIALLAIRKVFVDEDMEEIKGILGIRQ